MAKELTLEELLDESLTSDLKKFLAGFETKQVDVQTTPVKKSISTPEYRPYRGISGRDTPQGEMPDDPNLVDTPSGRGFSGGGLSDEHEGLGRDYVYTNDGGRQTGLETVGQVRPLNPEVDQNVSPEIVPQPSLRADKKKVYATPGREHFTGLATSVYIGMKVIDSEGIEWQVLAFSENHNLVTFQRVDGYKSRTALNKFLGKELPKCPFEIGMSVDYKTNIVTIEAINKSSQLLTIYMDGKKRQVRFSQVRLIEGGNYES